MRRRKVSFSSDPRWTAMKRAGLAIAVALVLLVVMLWFGDSGQPPRPLPESANVVPPQSDTIVPRIDTPMLPESDTTAQTDVEPVVAPEPVAEPVVTPDPVTGETGRVPVAPALVAGVVPNITTPPEPIKAPANPKTATNKSAPPPKVVDAPTKPPSLPDGYFVQLGVFDDTENVSRVFNNVTELGLPAQIQSRVVVGPFRNKREAEAARNRLKDIAEGTVLPPHAKASERSRAKSKSRQRAR
jgi:DedD protein